MWFRRRSDSDFHAEVEAHIRLEADRLISEGMPPAEAQSAARRAFGNAAIAREAFYESHRWLWWDQLRQDLRYGLRALRKTPAFTVVAVLTIMLGVGANTAVFSLVDAVLLRLLPVQSPKELVFLETVGSAGTSGAPPYPCFARLRAETRSFTGLAAFNSDEMRIEIDGKPEQAMGQVVSSNYFEVLGLKPALGRLMSIEDEKLNPPVAVISDRYWRRRFGGDPSVIGKTISFRRQIFMIVGVTPPEFWGLEPGRPVDVTVPINIERNLMADSGTWWFHAVGRLKSGTPEREALADSDAVFQSFLTDSGQPANMIKEYFDHVNLRPASHGLGMLRHQFSQPLYALMGIAGLVLLMAAANIANLLLARGMSRQREFAIRLATGAARTRLVRQLLTEGVLLFWLGAVPGVILARQGVRAIETMLTQGRRAITVEANLNWQVLGFTLAITLLAGILSSLFPAWRAFRTDPEQAMRDGHARTGESRGATMLTGGLVAFQVAVSLVLLVGAMTFLRTLINLRDVDPGFHNQEVLTMSIELPDGYLQAGKADAIWNETLRAVRMIPGVRSAGLAVLTPFSGRDRGGLVQVRGYQPTTVTDSVIRLNQVSEGYFETLGVPLLRGRLLSDRDTKGSPHVALINESAARKYFGNRDPIGQSLEFIRNGKVDSLYRIAGVVRDTKHMDLREPSPPFAFLSIRQPRDAERRITLAVASSAPGQQMALLQPIRNTISKVDPGLLISEVITIQRQLDSTLLTERLLSGLSSAFGVLALLLASVGLYGVLSYRVGQQRRSIGIRMALGASPSSVAVDVLLQSSLIVAAGLLVGLPFALAAARTADSMLWGVRPSDPAIYIGGAALLSLVGFASTYFPAQRASAIEPAEALRHQ